MFIVKPLVPLALRLRFFEFSPGMIRPYTQPKLYRNLVLDYQTLCDKMKVAWIWGAAKRIDEHEAWTLQSFGANVARP